MAAAPEALQAREKALQTPRCFRCWEHLCARDSIPYGSLGSLVTVTGLGWFLLTISMRRTCDVEEGGFLMVTLGCRFHCRYHFAKQRTQERIAREGTRQGFYRKAPTLILKERRKGLNSSRAILNPNRTAPCESTIHFKPGGGGGWRDGSVTKSTDCSSRGPEFNSQQPHGGSQPSVMGSDALFWCV
uniref:Cytochrome c oxidase assembly protein COX20, mitochondrial n=1 Tax=Rattus norvegicus TaxID=10116 RepID=A0A8I6AET2_RAT